jgi:dienelactone hydrolase
VVVAGKAFAGSTVQTASTVQAPASVQAAISTRAAPAAPAAAAIPAVLPTNLRLIQEDVRIAAPGGYDIAATILRPEGKGPFGVVVLNHGVPGSADEREKESAAADFNASAPVFARRGYVVVMPLRRGFGATGGPFAEDAGPCRRPDYMRAENNAADDVMAAYNYARGLPYVDPNRMILAGQSAGGIVSMFVAGTRAPQGLIAVLGFAAGRGGNPDLRPGVPCAVEPVAKVLDTIGKTIKVPVLLHYAQNDKYFGPATSKLWYDRITAAGAQAEYVMQPAFGTDGHYVFAELVGVRYWLPAVEKFFGEHHIAFERLDAAQPLLHAKLPNVPTASCQSLFRAFLEAPSPRAYAVSGDGRCGFAGAVSDAPAVALQECRSVSSQACALYAVDSEVVWKEPAADEPKQATATHAKSSSTAGSH